MTAIKLSDSITHYNTSGLSKRGVNALNNHGIFYWYQAKTALIEGRLSFIFGVGEKTISAII